MASLLGVRSDEFELVQNPALGAVALWQFTAEFFRATGAAHGARLPAMMVVLPLVLRSQSLASIKSRRLAGGLALAMAENRALTAHLGKWTVDFGGLTLRSLNLAMAGALIGYDSAVTEFFPLRKTSPPHVAGGSTSEICRGARRLGYWFATTDVAALSSLLRVKV